MLKTNPQATKFHIKHETHRKTLLKFVALALILVAYFLFMSWKYDASTGFTVTLLTWSFFVLCTPVADGGFILAFPIRLLFGIKMSITQIVLWLVALGINIFMLVSKPVAYDFTFLTKLLKHILTVPYPYWSILILSAVGTLLSIYFGDEMMDVTSHKDRSIHHRHKLKYRSVLVAGLGVLTVVSYYYLLNSLNIELPK
ncbi:hypothetical protein SAMN05216369_2477 [Marinobacter antarcticus]|uniref:Uncharacterized protein n=1 Tax=Marinobacter antarcticus TaxID=564117 RepID=A0A1M6TXS3_9GAMM|nr:hypothetical protein [Marinobacter antarcticus]SHK61739.1 hypothetical protein SAMN05216369_2477 [Marinobacter antarcticus]